MKILLPTLFVFSLLAGPALAQTVPPTPLQLQQQMDQTIQNQANATQQDLNQTQYGLIQDQQRRDQLFATPAPVFQPPLPPPPLPPAPQPKP